MNTLLNSTLKYLARPAGTLILAGLLLPAAASADSGFYLGGSVGTAGTELQFEDGVEFDEDDFAWKGFAGFNFDLPVIDLAVEGGYVNFGSPGGTVNVPGAGSADVDLDVDALSGFGLLGVDLGPIGVFAKAGVISWDAQSTIEGFGSDDESGTDPAYGVGARFSLGSVEIRVEYEAFDLDVDGIDSTDLSMVSAGLVWTF